MAAAGCGADAGAGAGYGPGAQAVDPKRQVVLRNNCPEAVRVHVGPAPPAVGAETIRVSANGVQELRLGGRDRVWLEVRGEWSRDRSARAPEDGWVIEVLADCAALGDRKGPL
jgi:hypothetical protein